MALLKLSEAASLSSLILVKNVPVNIIVPIKKNSDPTPVAVPIPPKTNGAENCEALLMVSLRPNTSPCPSHECNNNIKHQRKKHAKVNL